MSTPWYRICVDIDSTGGPIGASYELHSNDLVRGVHVLPSPGPFDTVEEAFKLAVADAADRYGFQLTLW